MTQAFESTSAITLTEIQTKTERPTESIPFMSLPDRESLVELVKLSGPLFFNMMGKIVCYSALTVRCTAYGVVPLAAHTIMMRFFFLYGCFGYSIGQTAQAFLPAAVYPVENKVAVRRIPLLSCLHIVLVIRRRRFSRRLFYSICLITPFLDIQYTVMFLPEAI
jgi:hypothetical protein